MYHTPYVDGRQRRLNHIFRPDVPTTPQEDDAINETFDLRASPGPNLDAPAPGQRVTFRKPNGESGINKRSWDNASTSPVPGTVLLRIPGPTSRQPKYMESRSMRRRSRRNPGGVGPGVRLRCLQLLHCRPARETGGNFASAGASRCRMAPQHAWKCRAAGRPYNRESCHRVRAATLAATRRTVTVLTPCWLQSASMASASNSRRWPGRPPLVRKPAGQLYVSVFEPWKDLGTCGMLSRECRTNHPAG